MQSPSSSSSSKCCLIPSATLKTMSPAPPSPFATPRCGAGVQPPHAELLQQQQQLRAGGEHCEAVRQVPGARQAAGQDEAQRAQVHAVHAARTCMRCACMRVHEHASFVLCFTHTHIYICIYVYMLSAASPARACTSFFAHSLPACLPACPACCPPLPEPCALPACRPALTHAPLPPARPLIAAGCSCSAP